jgi:hypothetical protein
MANFSTPIHFNLFQNFTSTPFCAILYDETKQPAWTACNEGADRAIVIDKLCQAIFDARTRGSDPSWYTEQGIQYETAMRELGITDEVKDRIGPQAKAASLLLAANGAFNLDGLHIFDWEKLVENLEKGRLCPNCRNRKAKMAFSKAYYCYVKYGDCNRYLTDAAVQREVTAILQTQARKIHFPNSRIGRILQLTDRIVRHCLLPLAVITIYSHYTFVTLDTIFGLNITIWRENPTSATLKLIRVFVKISDALSYITYAFMYYVYLRSGSRFGLIESHYQFHQLMLYHGVVMTYSNRWMKFFAVALVLNRTFISSNRFRQLQQRIMNGLEYIIARIDVLVQSCFKVLQVLNLAIFSFWAYGAIVNKCYRFPSFQATYIRSIHLLFPVIKKGVTAAAIWECFKHAIKCISNNDSDALLAMPESPTEAGKMQIKTTFQYKLLQHNPWYSHALMLLRNYRLARDWLNRRNNLQPA